MFKIYFVFLPMFVYVRLQSSLFLFCFFSRCSDPCKLTKKRTIRWRSCWMFRCPIQWSWSTRHQKPVQTGTKSRPVFFLILQSSQISLTSKWKTSKPIWPCWLPQKKHRFQWTSAPAPGPSRARTAWRLSRTPNKTRTVRSVGLSAWKERALRPGPRLASPSTPWGRRRSCQKHRTRFPWQIAFRAPIGTKWETDPPDGQWAEKTNVSQSHQKIPCFQHKKVHLLQTSQKRPPKKMRSTLFRTPKMRTRCPRWTLRYLKRQKKAMKMAPRQDHPAPSWR